jgi:hypothetical protein
MKTLINITAHAYSGNNISVPDRRYSFIRPRNAKTPTHAGAARMIASEIGCRPKDISVTRVEAMAYEAR